jgi:spermidine/putrescine-binding protein
MPNHYHILIKAKRGMDVSFWAKWWSEDGLDKETLEKVRKSLLSNEEDPADHREAEEQILCS